MALCADDANFGSYSSGIYSPSTDDCPCYPNHTILIVGYGYDTDSSKEYWIILNSWATTWGVGGYARVDFGITENPDCGMCGMFCDWVSYPTMKSEEFSTTEWASGTTYTETDLSATDTTNCPGLSIALTGMSDDDQYALSTTISDWTDGYTAKL